MKQLLRRLSKVADSSSSYALLRSSDSLTSPRSSRRTSSLRKPPRRRSVPSGHVPVYVGEEMNRYVVNADLMNDPIFIKLLNKSAQEYGYEQKGALRIPCNVVVFERVLHALTCGCDVSSDVLDLINSFSSDEVFIF